MDYILFQIERIADELRENGISVPGRIHPPPSTVEVPQETEVTTSKSSRSSVYLPQWLHNHRNDPAAMVTFMPRLVLDASLNGRHGRVFWSCCTLTSVNGYSPTRTTLSNCSFKTRPFTNTRSSTSNTRPTMSNRREISSTLGMVERVSWYTRQHLGKMRTSPGHMLVFWQPTMLLCALPPTPNHKPSHSCGYDGCNVQKLVSLDETHGTIREFLSFRGLAQSATHSTSLIRRTSSAPVTLFLPSTSDGPTISSIHLSLETHRGTGLLTTQIGTVV